MRKLFQCQDCWIHGQLLGFVMMAVAGCTDASDGASDTRLSFSNGIECTVEAEYLNLRNGPGTDYAVVGQVTTDAIATVSSYLYPSSFQDRSAAPHWVYLSTHQGVSGFAAGGSGYVNCSGPTVALANTCGWMDATLVQQRADLTDAQKTLYVVLQDTLTDALSQCSNPAYLGLTRTRFYCPAIQISECASSVPQATAWDASRFDVVIGSAQLVSKDSPFYGTWSQIGSYWGATSEEKMTYQDGSPITYPNTLVIHFDQIAKSNKDLTLFLKKLWLHEFAHIIQGQTVMREYGVPLTSFFLENQGQGPHHALAGRFLEACADLNLDTTPMYQAQNRMDQLMHELQTKNIDASVIDSACNGHVKRDPQSKSSLDLLIEQVGESVFQGIFKPY